MLISIRLDLIDLINLINLTFFKSLQYLLLLNRITRHSENPSWSIVLIVLFFSFSSSIFPAFSSICVVLLIFLATDFWPIVFCLSKAFFFFVLPCLRVFMPSPSFSCRRCNPKCKTIEWMMLLSERMQEFWMILRCCWTVSDLGRFT